MRDRTRTTCPYIASTMPQKAGEEAHENGIGMPPPPAAGAKVQECLPRGLIVHCFFSGRYLSAGRSSPPLLYG